MAAKKIYFIEFSKMVKSLVIVFLVSHMLANISDSIRLENFIQRQIEGYLSRVLPGNSYLVTVSVDAQMRRTQELKNETVNTYLKEENVTPPEPPKTAPAPEPTFEILPGLEKVFDFDQESRANTQSPSSVNPNRDSARSFREEKNDTSKEYTYNEQMDIREVSVQIALDDSLAPGLVQSVKNMIGSKMDITFGDKGSVIFSTVDLDQVRQEPTPVLDPATPPIEDLRADQPIVSPNPSNSLLEHYFDKYSSIFYLLLSILIFVGLLFLFVFFLWLFLRIYGKKDNKEKINDKPKNYPPAPEYNPPPPSNIAEAVIPLTIGGYGKTHNDLVKKVSPSPQSFQDEIFIGNREEKFLDRFLKEPLLSRKYFLSLPDEDKNELLSVIVSKPTKSVFRDIANNQSLGQEDLFSTDMDGLELERIRDQMFKKHIEGIEQYNKIYAPQMRDPFSKLSFFTEDELRTLFNSIGLEAASIIARNVDSQKMVPYINQLPENKRKEFLKYFNDDREISPREMEGFKNSLKQKTDELSKNIFIRKADNKFIKRKLLESSIDKKQFLESVRHQDPDFYNEFKIYTIDFNDFLNDTGDIFKRTIQVSENEDLTLALVGIKNEEHKNKILDSLPQIRRDFIVSYMGSRQNSTSKEEIKQAQENILDIYRKYLI